MKKTAGPSVCIAMLHLRPVFCRPLQSEYADVVELVDTQHSKCCAFGRVGSSPTFGTMFACIAGR